MAYSSLISEREQALLQQQEEAGTTFREGQVVVINPAGLLERLATITKVRHWSKDDAFFRHCVLVQTFTSTQQHWILRSALRPTTTRDLQPINGLRFSEWQERVYYGLLYRAHQTYCLDDLPQLTAWWEQGHSTEYATVQLIAAKQWSDYGLSNISSVHHRALLLNEPTLEQWASLNQTDGTNRMPSLSQSKGKTHAAR